MYRTKTLLCACIATVGVVAASARPAEARFNFASGTGALGSYSVTSGTVAGGNAVISITGGATYTFTAAGATLAGAFAGGFDYSGGAAGGFMSNVNVAADWIAYGDFEQVGTKQNLYGSDVYDNGYVRAVSGTTQKLLLWNTRSGTTNGVELTLTTSALTDNGGQFSFGGSTGNDNACATASTANAPSGNFCGNTQNTLNSLTGTIKSVVPSPTLLLGVLPIAYAGLKRKKKHLDLRLAGADTTN